MDACKALQDLRTSNGWGFSQNRIKTFLKNSESSHSIAGNVVICNHNRGTASANDCH